MKEEREMGEKDMWTYRGEESGREEWMQRQTETERMREGIDGEKQTGIAKGRGWIERRGTRWTERQKEGIECRKTETKKKIEKYRMREGNRVGSGDQIKGMVWIGKGRLREVDEETDRQNEGSGWRERDRTKVVDVVRQKE